jgi:L-ascorbate metabolism protein UlaG (beta-lactamase superfamily)
MAKPTRRHMLKGFGLALAAGAGWLGWRPVSANAYYNGPVSDHFNGQHFFNRGHEGPRNFGDLLRSNFLEKSDAWPESFPSPHAAPTKAHLTNAARDRVRVVYIGHASFLIQAQGQSILIDPVWSQRAGPVSFAGPKRYNPPAMGIDDLPKIDTIVITHNHYDHMDVATIGTLWAKFRPRIVTPLGNDTVLKQEAFSGGYTLPSGLRIDAVDWGDTVDLGGGLKLHAVPALHWSARGLRDRRHALWASFVLETPAHRLYCVGDTGFGDGQLFRDHGARFGSIDLALLPIGAFEPRWFMKAQHMNPAEAVAVFELLGAKRALGHHWGTFRLTNEGVETPPRELAMALAERGIAPARFVAVRPGAVTELE